MKNPFAQAREIVKLQQEAREMQKKLKSTLVTGKSGDSLISVTINGAQELEEIAISDSLLSVDSKSHLIKDFKQAFQSAQKELQKEMMKDFDFSKIKNMLG